MADNVGQKFNRWEILSKSEQRYPDGTRCFYLGKCDCGTIKLVRISDVKSGKSKSCGCLERELHLKRVLKHGESIGEKTVEYETWQRLRNRCWNETSADYKDYGARGITVCEEWTNDYLRFLSDMGRRPEGTSLDRIDNNRGYEPGNCRWATPGIQRRNQRRVQLFTLDGKSLCLTDWAKIAGTTREVLRTRLELGWDLQRAITQKIRHINRVKGRAACGRL